MSTQSFDHAGHAQRRWRHFLHHDSKGYAGLSIMALGLRIAKVVALNKRTQQSVAYLTKTTAKKLLVYPLVLGVTSAELLAWAASYWSHDKDDKTRRVTRDVKLVPAAFAVYGTTLNSVYPFVGRLRRVRSWLRPIKWGLVGLVVDRGVATFSTAQFKAVNTARFENSGDTK